MEYTIFGYHGWFPYFWHGMAGEAYILKRKRGNARIYQIANDWYGTKYRESTYDPRIYNG